jgi:hypothetical protein
MVALMVPYTPDPANPRGRRSGSLPGSGTHDERSTCDPQGGIHDEPPSPDEPLQAVAQAAGDGATELTAWIASHIEGERRS